MILFIIILSIIALTFVVWLFIYHKRKTTEIKQDYSDKITQLEQDHFDKVSQLEQDLSKFSTISDIEAEQERIRLSIAEEQRQAQENVNALEVEIDRLNHQQNDVLSLISNARENLTSLEKEIAFLEDFANIQSFGLYEPKYDFDTSAEYKSKLEDIRTKQKSMIR